MTRGDKGPHRGDAATSGRRPVGLLNARVLAAKGDVTVQLGDLLVFMGYFGLCLYAGGVAYAEAYNDELRLAILSTDSVIATAQLYLQEAIGLFWSGLGLLFSVAVLSYAYVLARFALRLWAGLALVIGTFCLLFLFCVVTGAVQGRSAADTAFLRSGDNPLPVIKAARVDGLDLDDGSYRLLHDSGSHLFVLQPTAERTSLRQIHSLLKENLPTYEVILP